MRQHEAAQEMPTSVYNATAQVEQELNETFQKSAKRKRFINRTWNSRLERLLEYDPNILEELPENAWLMTLDEVAEYLQDNDIDRVGTTRWTTMSRSTCPGHDASDEELMRFEYEIKDLAISDEDNARPLIPSWSE